MLEEDTAVGGFAMHGVAGAAAIVLGILALLGVLPGVLVAIAVLAMGGAMLFGGPTRAELNLSALEQGGVSSMGRRAATKAVHNSAGLLILVGLASITLGILALVQVPFAPTLLLVALLALGATLLLGDSLLLGGIGSSLFRSRHARQHA